MTALAFRRGVFYYPFGYREMHNALTSWRRLWHTIIMAHVMGTPQFSFREGKIKEEHIESPDARPMSSHPHHSAATRPEKIIDNLRLPQRRECVLRRTNQHTNTSSPESDQNTKVLERRSCKRVPSLTRVEENNVCRGGKCDDIVGYGGRNGCTDKP